MNRYELISLSLVGKFFLICIDKSCGASEKNIRRSLLLFGQVVTFQMLSIFLKII